METPLISVICICYNHGPYISEAISSVLRQSYDNIQLIIIDDASTDNSVVEIKASIKNHKDVQLYVNEENLGNCKSFNRGFAQAVGKYIIDLSGDDIFYDNRVEEQVRYFESLSNDYGVVFSDATIINELGDGVGIHSKRQKLSKIATGDVFSEVLSKYFISAPTMMVKKEVLDVLEGYDESLAYEDFDFWVRSSRIFKYAYQNKRLTKVRKLNNSLSSRQYSKNSKLLLSTYEVCIKALTLVKSKHEYEALALRAKYEARQSVISENFDLGIRFYELVKKINKMSLLDRFFYYVAANRIKLSTVSNVYRYLKY